ncbi:MAG: transcription-repair coupling factor [Anaerolinea sp.]|nr:transcription-repair coupling factor [Anaerolinea sp.]
MTPDKTVIQLSGLLELLRSAPTYKALLDTLRQPGKPSAELGVLRAARPYVAAALARDWGAPVVYLTARIDRAYNVTEQFPVWFGEDAPIYRFAEPASPFYERVPWGESALRNRISTLGALLDERVVDRHPVVVTSARALMQRTMPVNTFRTATQTLKVGDRWDIGKLLARWQQIGYDGTTMVIEPGTFSRRGGILDIYPLAQDRPVRIEFFDDEIDSLRHFDPATQRSTEKITQITITPAREVLPEHAPPLATTLGSWFDGLPALEADVTSPLADRDSLATGSAFPFLETYLPYIYGSPVSLLDYAPHNALILVDDASELRDVVTEIEAHAAQDRDEKVSGQVIPPDYPQPYISWERLVEAIREHSVVYLGHADTEDDSLGGDHTLFEGLIVPEMRFGGQLKSLLTHLRKLRNDGDRVIAVTTQAARLTELWQEQESTYLLKTNIIITPPAPETVTFVEGTMSEGWRLRTGDGGEAHLFTDAEVFGWSRPEPRRRKVVRRAKTPEGAYADMHEGDYVVHVDYGVGKFIGMRRRTLEGVEREYLLIEYAGTDTLFVPIHQADRLARYVGPDDKPPALNKLGVADWSRIKGRAKKAVEEEARDLLALYAARASAPGYAFNVDTPWQHELEASFPYVETDDQLRAVADVKTDMEKPHPMDRLVCGDVGYGKTEVALRAAFKAVNDGKQVAILVPTTILAQQHYETFSRRLSAFPIKVEMLSRFRTPEEQKRALKQLESGEIDIIIGTHRLIQNDVKMKNLGLVVIDEEQRFGVKHKEHFKKLRTQVDILTLTATPIPRTLYMGLTGVRDISMIQTAPEDRLPVITHVGAFDDRLVRQAVIREMERGGQVFVVHNRINTIDALRERLEKIVPEARIVTGHGQMDNNRLERVMEEFANGEYDILLATAIIESGLDIPNANTLIIDRADLFGLAQLYQLRGRVGRGAQQAYAYIFHPPSNRLTDEARARLETLREYTDLGSGYQIAMRDLELRGAGDILSTRQTGHVAAIGLNLYTQMLAQAVRELKGEAAPARTPDGVIPAPILTENSIIIDLPMPAYLPTDYIPELALRLQIYRRIGGLADALDVEAMRNELRDRFGQLPAAVEGLLFQIHVKIMAQAANATHVLYRDDKIETRLPYLVEVNRDRLAIELGDDVTVTRTAVELALDPANDDWRYRLIEVLTYLAENVRIAAGR